MTHNWSVLIETFYSGSTGDPTKEADQIPLSAGHFPLHIETSNGAAIRFFNRALPPLLGCN